MPHIIKLRRDSAERWRKFNPILGDGEPGVERETGRLKIGNGGAAWNDLPYLGAGASDLPSDSALFAHVTSPLPHPVYDDGPSLELLYENSKV